MTADDKYSFLIRDNLIQIQLSQKQKTFSEVFSLVLKCKLNFEHFRIKDDPKRGCTSEITDSDKRG